MTKRELEDARRLVQRQANRIFKVRFGNRIPCAIFICPVVQVSIARQFTAMPA